MKKVDYWYIIPVILLNLIGFLFRSLRWKYLIEPVKIIRLLNLFSSVMIGFMANNVLPVRLGEIVRAYSIGKMEKISRSSAFATVVVERVLDIFFILLVFLILFFLFPFSVSFPDYLLENTYKELTGLKFNVYFQKHYPTNDGGISLGQIVLANKELSKCV